MYLSVTMYKQLTFPKCCQYSLNLPVNGLHNNSITSVRLRMKPSLATGVYPHIFCFSRFMPTASLSHSSTRSLHSLFLSSFCMTSMTPLCNEWN